MAALGVGLAWGLEGRWVWTSGLDLGWAWPWGWAGALALGLGLGAASVAGSRAAARVWPSVRRLEQTLRAWMRPGGLGWAGGLAACSSIGEEALFRGWLLPASGKLSTWALASVGVGEGAHRLAPWLGLLASSLVFGLAHLRPGAAAGAWPWMAAFWGLFLGGAFLATGNLLAPTVAHFTINLVGLWTMAREARRSPLGESYREKA
jgi:membrane protease YdiL (CAAX protease family)